MGKRITIDSATLMNKGFEVIEACWLFDFAPYEVEVVVHPQSTVHAMVEYMDGSVIAQISATDMRMPIQYALTYPERAQAPVPRMDWSEPAVGLCSAGSVTSFPCCGWHMSARKPGGSATCTLNAADEIAVEAFLGRRIPFPAICARWWRKRSSRMPQRQPGSMRNLEIDRESRPAPGAGGNRYCAAEEQKPFRAEPVVDLKSLNFMIVLQNVLWLLVLIGVMILIHELGHFWPRVSSTSRSTCSASASARGCSASARARRTTGSPPSCSAATSRWPASSPATKPLTTPAASWPSRAGSG